MYTRYSGVDVPQNYSGSRFRKKIIEETEMKVHTSTAQGAVKSSVSPTFESQIKGEHLPITVSENDSDYSETVEDVAENDASGEEYTSLQYEVTKENDDREQNIGRSILNDLNLSSITEYLKSIKGEDLLLIALIIFLASDKDVSNNDIIILLALLLIYHS